MEEGWEDDETGRKIDRWRRDKIDSDFLRQSVIDGHSASGRTAARSKNSQHKG